ncbi:MAG: hypothetical protein ABEJ07_00670 [Candidatus Nanohaloarchaea archaeon]
MRGFPHGVLLSGIVLSFIAGSAGLFAAGAFDPAENANESDLVVHGEVVYIGQAGYIPLRGTEISHPVTVRVNETFKGEARGSVTFRVAGGTIPGVRGVHVSTAPDFERGEEVVVMLQRSETGYMVTRGEPGKYEVVNGRNCPGPGRKEPGGLPAGVDSA